MADPVSASIAAAAEPVTLMVEKVSNALGRHFDPRQTVRMAEAQARANQILRFSEAETDIEIAELRHRAGNRFMFEEMRNQSNMEAITQRSFPHLTDGARPDQIEDDWITNFFEKCRNVSNELMQELWAKVLAGEGNRPGSFSRKTVNLIADLGANDAKLFVNLCRFGWTINRTIETLIYDEQSDIYSRVGINYNSIRQLEALGLVHFEGLAGVSMVNLPRNISASYGERRLNLSFPNADGNKLNVGRVLLTQSGRELFRISEARIVEGFYEYVYDRWASQSLLPPREKEPEAYFQSLAKQWLAETAMHSNPAIIARHPTYPQIVGLGEHAVPFILAEISEARNRPHWFQALHDILGTTPAPEDSWGNVEAVAAAWLEWGKKEGHLR